MAFTKTITLQGGVTVANAYIACRGFSIDLLHKVLRADFCVFKDQPSSAWGNAGNVISGVLDQFTVELTGTAFDAIIAANGALVAGISAAIDAVAMTLPAFTGATHVS